MNTSTKLHTEAQRCSNSSTPAAVPTTIVFSFVLLVLFSLPLLVGANGTTEPLPTSSTQCFYTLEMVLNNSGPPFGRCEGPMDRTYAKREALAQGPCGASQVALDTKDGAPVRSSTVRCASCIPGTTFLEDGSCTLGQYCADDGQCRFLDTHPLFNASCPYDVQGHSSLGWCGAGLHCFGNRCRECEPGIAHLTLGLYCNRSGLWAPLPELSKYLPEQAQRTGGDTKRNSEEGGRAALTVVAVATSVTAVVLLGCLALIFWWYCRQEGHCELCTCGDQTEMSCSLGGDNESEMQPQVDPRLGARHRQYLREEHAGSMDPSPAVAESFSQVSHRRGQPYPTSPDHHQYGYPPRSSTSKKEGESRTYPPLQQSPMPMSGGHRQRGGWSPAAPSDPEGMGMGVLNKSDDSVAMAYPSSVRRGSGLVAGSGTPQEHRSRSSVPHTQQPSPHRSSSTPAPSLHRMDTATTVELQLTDAGGAETPRSSHRTSSRHRTGSPSHVRVNSSSSTGIPPLSPPHSGMHSGTRHQQQSSSHHHSHPVSPDGHDHHDGTGEGYDTAG